MNEKCLKLGLQLAHFYLYRHISLKIKWTQQQNMRPYCHLWSVYNMSLSCSCTFYLVFLLKNENKLFIFIVSFHWRHESKVVQSDERTFIRCGNPVCGRLNLKSVVHFTPLASEKRHYLNTYSALQQSRTCGDDIMVDWHLVRTRGGVHNAPLRASFVMDVVAPVLLDVHRTDSASQAA